jgi:hypothetical protein
LPKALLQQQQAGLTAPLLCYLYFHFQATLAVEAARMAARQEKLRAAVEGLAAAEPAAAAQLECALAHVAVLSE